MPEQADTYTFFDYVYINYRKVVIILAYCPSFLLTISMLFVLKEHSYDLRLLVYIGLVILLIVGILVFLNRDLMASVLFVTVMAISSLLIIYTWGLSDPIGILLFILSCHLCWQLCKFPFSTIFNSIMFALLVFIVLLERYGVIGQEWGLLPNIDFWSTLSVTILLIIFILVAWVSVISKVKRVERIKSMEKDLQRINHYLQSEVSLHHGLEPAGNNFKSIDSDRFLKMNLLYHYGLLASSLAHNMANPIMLIMARLKEVRFEKREEVMNALDELVASMRSIGASINMSDDEEVVDVKKALVESISSLQWRIDSMDVRFTYKIPKKELFIHGSFIRFKSILLSLITNSLEAVENQKDRFVKIRLFTVGEIGVLFICNSGRKISGKNLKNLFNLFSSSKPSGNGLGLFISREDARNLFGGDITLLKNEHNNICFKFTFRLK